MPQYYFDTEEGDKLYEDQNGVELGDDNAARDEATLALAELARDFIPKTGPKKVTMSVRDEGGKIVVQLSLEFSIRPFR